MTSRDDRGQFFHPWSRSATTQRDLVRRARTLMGDLLSQACERRQHQFEIEGPMVTVDVRHDIVVLDNYNRMCLETFDWQPKATSAEDFGQVGDFSRFLLSVDQMLEAARDPRLNRLIYRPFWGPLGEARPEPHTVFLLLDDWNPRWVRNRRKSEWASDLLVATGVWELSQNFQQKAQEIDSMLQLVGGRINFEYCHWGTFHN